MLWIRRVFATGKPYQPSVMQHSSLLGLFVSFEETEVLWIWLPEPKYHFNDHPFWEPNPASSLANCSENIFWFQWEDDNTAFVRMSSFLKPFSPAETIRQAASSRCWWLQAHRGGDGGGRGRGDCREGWKTRRRRRRADGNVIKLFLLVIRAPASTSCPG